jgi:hypothetical protein
MKKLLIIAVSAIAFTSCFSTRESIQAELVDAELIKVDTVERYLNTYQQVLTWKTSDHFEYMSYAPMGRKYLVGTRMSVLIRN